MATYSLDEVMAGDQPAKNTYSLEDVLGKPSPPTLTSKLLSAVNLAGKAGTTLTPMGIGNYVQNKGNEIVRKGSQIAGDYVFDKTNSPALATAVTMIPDVANLVVGNKVAGMSSAVKESNQLGKAAERIGYKPSLPQRTGSPDLANLYDTLSNMPGSARVIATHEARNAKAINSAVARSIGQNSNRVTGDVLANASDDLGAVRNTLKETVNIPKGSQNITSAIDNATIDLKRSLQNNGRFKGDMERIKQGVNSGNITGEQYQIWRTDLKDAADTAYTSGKSQLGKAYKTVLSALDDAARGTASKEWLDNDKKFSVLNTVQKGNIVNPVTGDVSAPLLTNQFYRDYGNFAKQGKLPGEINDIATVTRGYPALKEGSQTARRENYNSLVPWALSPFNYLVAKGMVANPANFRRLLPYQIPLDSATNGLLGYQTQP
jgi:hypothetical protein